ncbi:MAG TPA: radical SAM family heme chaperone HemW [Syntrophaceticus sp.]|nr:radical SAM family heme chaperone HemW [Syntrophaceticus sp.]
MTALYIHFPFCLQKCRYCSFNSIPIPRNVMLVTGYLQALEREIALYASHYPNESLSSIYLGGGTPTVLPAETLCRILFYCRENFAFSPEIEITIEANPGTVTQGMLQLLRDAGVNRLSLGVQSFKSAELQMLGRSHSVSDVYAAYDAARKAGFDNINLDLIYALPGQSLQSWRENLCSAIQLGPEHLSIYGLSLEEDTPLADDLKKGKLEACSEEMHISMWEETASMVAKAGFIRYEISNYAKPGKVCRHNITYWENKTYLGVGAGAHGYYDHVRYGNENNIQKYIERVEKGEFPRAFEEHQSQKEEMVDTIIMGLRLTKGLSRQKFARRFGCSFESLYEKELKKMVEDGLMAISDEAIFLTERGQILSNYVLSHFV